MANNLKNIKFLKKTEKCSRCGSISFNIETHAMVKDGIDDVEKAEEGILRIICAGCHEEHSEFYYGNGGQ